MGNILLASFTAILCCQLAGELLVTALGIPVPGPVAGMGILFAFLLIKGAVPDSLAATADNLLSHLSLLFVPAGVGIMAHFALLREEWPALMTALVLSTLATIAVTAGLMSALAKKAEPDGSDE